MQPVVHVTISWAVRAGRFRRPTRRHPSAFTPVAIRQCTFTVRPPSRTFQFSASIQQDVYGPRSSGRFRNPSTTSSSSAAITLTCDLDSPVTPREAASFSTRRVETPSRYDVATTEASARPARRRCSRNPGKYDPWGSLGMASPLAPGVLLPPPVPVAGVHPVRADLPVPRIARDLDVGVHHPLGELPDHRAQQVRARRCQGLLELRAGNRHNVTCGHFALLRCSETTSKDREVAASHHGDTPYSGNSITSVPVTPYTTSVDVNVLTCGLSGRMHDV